MARFKGKTVVVTGCASGIGAQTARVLSDAGAHVLGADLQEPEEFNNFFRVDIGSRESIDAFIGALPDNIDGLANIAGVPPTHSPEQVIKVNLVGTIYLTKSILPKLKNGAAIVNTSSIAGYHWQQSVDQITDALSLDFDGIGSFVRTHNIDKQLGRSYFLTKEALIVWTIQTLKAWSNHGIRMNCVSPGGVATPLLESFADMFGDRAKRDIDAVERVGQPADIAPVIAFLLSDDSAWIRGANIPVDAGVAAGYLAGEFKL